MSDYSKLTDNVNGRKIQVDSAIRDGQGNKIDTRYITSDGYYEQLGAGYADVADNLTPYSDNGGLTKSECFTFQTSGGGSNIGSTSQLKELKGRTFVFNQLVRSVATKTQDGITLTNNGDGSYTLTGTAEATTYFYLTDSLNISGHKLLIKTGLDTQVSGFRLVDGNSGTYSTYTSDIHTINTNNVVINIRVDSGTNLSSGLKIIPQVIDLTLMFGSGSEPEYLIDFDRLFIDSYYEYNSGTLVSPQSSKVITTGFNQWDEVWEVGFIDSTTGEFTSANNRIVSSNYIPVICGQTYRIETPYNLSSQGFHVFYYDGEHNYIGYVDTYNRSITLGSNVHYIKISPAIAYGTTYHNDICIHLEWDGSRNGEYEQYVKYEYSLPNVELRNVEDVYDNLLPNGTLTRKVGIVDLGTITWNYVGTNYTAYATGIATLVKKPADYDTKAKALCSKYNVIAENAIGSANCLVISPSGSILIKDSSLGETGAEVKASLSGIYLVYELNEPTTEQVSAYTENIVIDDFGTQEFVGNGIPQCSTWFYAVDYKAFIDSLGNRQDIGFDASEIVSHTELTTAISQIPQPDLTALESDVSPKTNNTYDLGSSTYKWKDLHISGNITDGTNSVKVSELGSFPIIPAPSSTTLTTDEFNKISKGAIVLTTFLTYERIVFMPIGDLSFGERGGIALCVNGFTPEIRVYKISSQNVISLYNTTEKRVRLQSVTQINGKAIPDYPSSTGTFVLKCVNGTLTWVAE